MATGALLRKQPQAFAERAALGMGLWNLRALSERGDEADQRIDLAFAVRGLAALGCVLGLAQRHAPGTEVEVGAQLAHTDERRPPAVRTFAEWAVAADAVRHIQIVASLDQHRTLRAGDCGGSEDGDEERQDLHAW
jgi:hypothetical protein